jgi:hypothetical protein
MVAWHSAPWHRMSPAIHPPTALVVAVPASCS